MQKTSLIKCSLWTDEELNILRDNHSILSYNELGQLLPGRSYDSIKIKISKLKLFRPHHLRPMILPLLSPEERLRRKKKRDKEYNDNRRTRKGPEFILWEGAKCRAKKRNLDFNLKMEDIVIPTRCPVLGIPIFPGKEHIRDNSPSLDRIKSDKGYFKENVWVISNRANRIKNDSTLAELEMLVLAIKNKLINL